MYVTEEHLRSLAAYLMTTAADIGKREKSGDPGKPPAEDPAAEDNKHALKSLARQIEVIDYNPVLFESILETYDLHVGSLEGPIENAPLHINDESAVEQAVVKWRLENAV